MRSGKAPTSSPPGRAHTQVEAAGVRPYALTLGRSIHQFFDGDTGTFERWERPSRLGGHISVGARAFLSAAVALHQSCRIGQLCMVSGLAGVTMDCLPFTMVTGAPARVVGLNKVGLKRAGMDPEAIADLKRAFQRLFVEAGVTREALAARSEWPSPLVREWVEFIQGSSRGFARQRP